MLLHTCRIGGEFDSLLLIGIPYAASHLTFTDMVMNLLLHCEVEFPVLLYIMQSSSRHASLIVNLPLHYETNTVFSY